MQTDLRHQNTQFCMQNQQQHIQPNQKDGLFGFNARMFPLLGAILSTATILGTYFVARDKNPPDVPAFPWTDITHTAIKFPEYVIFRIGMMVTPVLFCISFQILKNYILIKSYQIKGQGQPRVNKFGTLSIVSCLMLCLSTSTISDGKDMDWTSHTVGATSFFILSMYMCITASKIYRELYFLRPGFCSKWSFYIKKYTNWVVVFFLVLTLLDSLKMIKIGSFVQWAATFYLVSYFASLYDDFKGLDIMMERTKVTNDHQSVDECDQC